MNNTKEGEKETKKKSTIETIFTGLGDIFRILFWFCYLNKKLHLNLYCYNLDFYFSFLFRNIGKAITCAAIILFLILLFLRKSFWKSVGLSIGYIIRFFWRLYIFPIRVIVIAIKIFVFVPNALGNLIKLPRKIEVFLISAVLYFIGLVNIIQSNEKLLLQLSLFFILAFVFCIWEWLYFWSKDPYWWVYGFRLPDAFDKILSLWEEQSIIKKLKKSNGKDPTNKDILEAKKNIWHEFKFLNWCQKKFNPKVSKRRLLGHFLVVLAFVSILTIVAFAFSYYAIQKYDPNSLNGIGKNIWEFIYFSAITFLNFDIGNYNPVGIWTKILLIMELFSFLFLLTITILTFTTSSDEGARETIDFVQGKIEDKKRKLAIILSENFQLEEKQLLQYKEDDFKKEEKGVKIQEVNIPKEIIDVEIKGSEDDEIEKRILLLEASDSWDEAARNVRYLFEVQDKFSDSDVLRIVDIVLKNDQILSSFAARPLLKTFFSKNIKVIPKEKFEAFFNAIK